MRWGSNDPFFQLKREKEGERPTPGISTHEKISFAKESHSISVPSWKEFVVSFQVLLDCFSCQNYMFAMLCRSSKIYWNKGNIWMRFETTSFSPVRKVIPTLQINVGMWFPVFSLHMSSQTPNRSKVKGQVFSSIDQKVNVMDLAQDDPDFLTYNAFIFTPCGNTDSLAQKLGERLKAPTHSSITDLSHISNNWNKSYAKFRNLFYRWTPATFWPL